MKKILLFMLVGALTLGAASSCKDDNMTTPNTESNPSTATNRDKLNAALLSAASKNEADYTPDSWSVFETALDAAKAVAAKSNATDAQLASALATLNTASGNLTLHANDGTLNATLATAKAKAQAGYTPASWNALQSAISSAQNVADDDNASQAQVNNANTMLQNAIDALVPVGSSKEELDGKITDAEAVDQSKYTAASDTTLQHAINDAEAVSSDTTSTSTDYADAYKEVQDAMDGLVPLVGTNVLSILSVGNSYGNLGSNTGTANPGLDSENLRAMLSNSTYFGPSSSYVKIDQLKLMLADRTDYQSSDTTAFAAQLNQANVVLMPGYGLDNTLMGTTLGDVSPQCATAIVNWLKGDTKRVLILTFDTSDDNGNTQAALVNSGYITYNLAWSNDWAPLPGEAGVPAGSYYYGKAPSAVTNGDAAFLAGKFGDVNRTAFFHAKDGSSQFTPGGTSLPTSVIPIMNVGIYSAATSAESQNMIVGVDVTKRIVWMGESQLGSNNSNTAGMTSSNPTDSAINMIMGNLWAWIVGKTQGN